MAILQIEVIETATDADFSYPEHDPVWAWPGVCWTCGRLHPSFALPPEPVNDLGGQAEAPRFGQPGW